jgi:crotonobetainyl-CoA:carnitine CoA-transferase CaiB-like acyl-CoA transferase
MIGPPNTLPAIPMNLVADYGGASMHAALGVMFALFARERTGLGQFVDVSYLDSTFALLAASPPVTAWLAGGPPPDRRRGLFTGGYPYYSIYEDSEGMLMTISATEPWIFRNLCEAVGRPELTEGAMAADVFVAEAGPVSIKVRDALQDVFRTKTRAEWFEELGAANVCVGVVASVEEAYRDPQIRHRGMAQDVGHPNSEGGSVLHPGIAIKLSATPGGIRSMPPGIAVDTDDVLQEIGYDSETIGTMRRDGAI